jgi:hypothetical protein
MMVELMITHGIITLVACFIWIPLTSGSLILRGVLVLIWGTRVVLCMMIRREGIVAGCDDLSLDRRYSAVIGTDCRHWY